MRILEIILPACQPQSHLHNLDMRWVSHSPGLPVAEEHAPTGLLEWALGACRRWQARDRVRSAAVSWAHFLLLPEVVSSVLAPVVSACVLRVLTLLGLRYMPCAHFLLLLEVVASVLAPVVNAFFFNLTAF